MPDLNSVKYKMRNINLNFACLSFVPWVISFYSLLCLKIVDQYCNLKFD